MQTLADLRYYDMFSWPPTWSSYTQYADSETRRIDAWARDARTEEQPETLEMALRREYGLLPDEEPFRYRLCIKEFPSAEDPRSVKKLDVRFKNKLHIQIVQTPPKWELARDLAEEASLEYRGETLTTVSMSVFRSCLKAPDRRVFSKRDEVLRRQDYKCNHCGSPEAPWEFDLNSIGSWTGILMELTIRLKS